MTTLYDGGASLIVPDDPLGTLRNCEGYYKCPMDELGRPQGPLVAYAGTYLDGAGKEQRLVGSEYYNFAMAEIYPRVLRYFARCLEGMVQLRTHLRVPDAVLGTPMGGLALSAFLAEELDCRYIFAEKKGPRGAQELVMSRHSIQPGWKVLVGEELVNNRKSAGKVLRLIEEAGAECIGVAGAINRNEEGIKTLPGTLIPIIMVIEVPTPQYRQDDPLVLDTLRRGYPIVWEGKEDWLTLKAAMEQSFVIPMGPTVGRSGTTFTSEKSIDEGRD